MCEHTEERQSLLHTCQFQDRQDQEKETLRSQEGPVLESISGTQAPHTQCAGSAAQAAQLTFPVLSMPLMTQRYTVAQQATRQRNRFHWIVPGLLMSDVMFRVCRYQK